MSLLPHIMLVFLTYLILPFLFGWSISIVRQQPFWMYLLVTIPILAFSLIHFRGWDLILALPIACFLAGFSLPIGQSQRKKLFIVVAVVVVALVLSWWLLLTYGGLPDVM